jgi:hypothetical protein
LNSQVSEQNALAIRPRLDFSSWTLNICVSPVESAAYAALLVIRRLHFRRFSVVLWKCFVCFSGALNGDNRRQFVAGRRIVSTSLPSDSKFDLFGDRRAPRLNRAKEFKTATDVIQSFTSRIKK